MKQVVCEMCGSTDLIKQDGLFVCQSCGIKYSLEEAKKLMVEGTVKIDKTDDVQNLLKRAFMHLEDKDWENANAVLEQILNQEPENAQAYVGKLMLQLKAQTQEQIADIPVLIDGSIHYKRIMQFGSKELKETFTKYAKKANPVGSIDQIASSKNDLKDGVKIVIINDDIAPEAFKGCDGIEQVIMLDGVTHIGTRAFEKCWLTNVTLPNTLKSIGEGVFRECWRLESVILPNYVTSIPKATFFRCTSLTSVVLPYSITDIGSFAFGYCKELEITIPRSVKSIGESAFDCGMDYNCNYYIRIKGLRFEGTTEEWQRINKDKGRYGPHALCSDTLELQRDEQERIACERQARIQKWKDSGLCQYCGGTFKGFFTKVCEKCNKQKDY